MNVTPPPPPAPPFPAKASVTYNAITGSAGYQGTIHDPIAGGLATVTPATTNGSSATTTFAYDATSQTYTMTGASGSASFAPADKAAASDYSLQFKNGNDSLYLYGNAATGTAGTAPVTLSYSSFAVWTHVDPATSLNQQTFYLFGQTTPTSGMPTSGSASYGATARAYVLQYWGNALANVLSLGGTATLTANFGSGAIDTTLTFDPGKTGQPQTLQATYTGTGTISGSGFSGSITGPGSAVTTTGGFVGGFFGPAANEAGYTFRIQNTINDPYAGASVPPYISEAISGVVVGAKKN